MEYPWLMRGDCPRAYERNTWWWRGSTLLDKELFKRALPLQGF